MDLNAEGEEEVEEIRKRSHCEPSAIGAIATLLTALMILCILTAVILVDVRQRNMPVPPEAIVDEGTRLVTQYNLGLQHPKQPLYQDNEALIKAFCWYTLGAAGLYSVFTKRPRLVDALAAGVLFALIVLLLGGPSQHANCHAHAIIASPHETGTLCATK